MKNRKSFLRYGAAVVIGAVAFTSCIDDPEPPALTVLPDVFVQKEVHDGVEKYGLAFWVLGNKDMKTVTVEGPGTSSWILESDQSTSRVFSLFPDEDDYSASKPAEGDYKFRIKSTQTDEPELTVIDKLENTELAAVVISSTEFVNSKLKTTWGAVANADTYLVRMYNSQNKLVFMGPKLSASATTYSFGSTDQGWSPGVMPETDKTYRVEVLALLYEANSQPTDKEYNVQFISIRSVNVVWQ